MTVTDIQSLIDLLSDSRTVTDIAVTAGDGSTVAVKRPLVFAHPPMLPMHAEVVEEASIVDVGESVVSESSDGIITSPLVGIFHAAKPPIADGATVRLGQIVGYVESMRLMSELKADVEGVVTEIMISDRQPVEYGQPLFRIMPSIE